MPEGDRQAQIEARFGASAQEYASSPGHRAGPDLDRLLELAEPQLADVMLDVATGAGHTALAFAPFVSRVCASDMARGMIEAATKLFEQAGRTNVWFETVAVEDLHSLGAELFDLVTCRIAPHHFLDPQRAAGEIFGVLKPGGRFVMEDNQGAPDPLVDEWLHDVESRRDPTHVRSHTESRWRTFLTGAGFELVHTETMFKRHEFEPWLARGGCDARVAEAVRGDYLHAPAGVREYLRIETDGDRVIAWSDPKLLVVARRPR